MSETSEKQPEVRRVVTRKLEGYVKLYYTPKAFVFLANPGETGKKIYDSNN